MLGNDNFDTEWRFRQWEYEKFCMDFGNIVIYYFNL